MAEANNQNQIPSPPINADLDLIHKHLLSLNSWMKLMFGGGNQAIHFSQAQLTQMVTANDKTQAGKMFFNTDTLKTQKATIVTGNLTITDF